MNSPKRVQISPVTEFSDYSARLTMAIASANLEALNELARTLLLCWEAGHQVFLCGNGGSAANAIHIANDFLYGVSKTAGSGLRVNALAANPSVVTCLANDEGYENIFSLQLAVQARAGDVLVVLSGSGNSPNILRAIEFAKRSRMKTFALLGYSGGAAKAMVDVAIHFAVDDMQISEDLQMLVLHSMMQWLQKNRPPSV